METRSSCTSFTESNALLAVVREDLDEAREIISTMLSGERRALARQAHQLADLCQEHDLLCEVATGPCRWAYRCRAQSAGYIVVGRRPDEMHPSGICLGHQPEAQAAGYAIHEPPTEVTL